MSSRRLAFCSAAAGALWLAWPSLLPSHPPCRAWSCHTPRITRPQARWPSPRDDLSTDALNRWHALHELHVGQARARGSDLVFLGDSITEGWLRTGFSSLRESLPQPECEAVWQRAFKQWQPLNFGIGGDRAQDVGWRIQHGLLPASLDPRVIVLLIGTNDIGKGEDPQVALTETCIVAQQLHSIKPRAQLLLVGLLPRGGGEIPGKLFSRKPAWDSSNKYFTSIHMINQGLAAFAQEYAWVTYLEPSNESSPFVRLPHYPQDKNKTGSVASHAQGAYIPYELMYDLLHLSPQGYQVFSHLLVPALENILNGHGKSFRRKQTNGSRRGDATSPMCTGRSCRGPDVDLP